MKKNYEEDHSDVLIAPRLMSLPPPPRRLLLSQIPMARAVVLTIPGDTFYSMAQFLRACSTAWPIPTVRSAKAATAIEFQIRREVDKVDTTEMILPCRTYYSMTLLMYSVLWPSFGLWPSSHTIGTSNLLICLLLLLICSMSE